MRIDVTEEPMPDLAEYARVPIAFEVRQVFDVASADRGIDGFVLRDIDPPYVKDYDALEGPESWAERFDLTHWGWFAARMDGRRVGGAVVAFDTPGVHMLEGRRDLAVLWDIRVEPDARGHGIGAALFRAAEAWATARGCRQLKIETQNINVPACRFYARQGCRLGSIDRDAYAGLLDEVQVIWYRDLVVRSPDAPPSAATRTTMNDDSERVPTIHEVFTYLIVDGGAAAIDFYTRVFGARETMRLQDPGGRIGHAELQLGPVTLMLADEHPDIGIRGPLALGGTGVRIHLHVDDVDTLTRRAEAAGATVVYPPTDQPHGERQSRIRDPFGHEWLLGHPVGEPLTNEEIKRRYEDLSA